MIGPLVDLLEADERLGGWQLRETRRRSSQLFLNPLGVESEREVETLQVEVEILVMRRVTEGAKKRQVTGNARFTLSESDLGRAKQELNLAYEAASLVDNEAYAMTEVAGVVPQVPLADAALEKEPAAALRVMAEQLKEAAAAVKGVRFSAAEFFADRTRLRHFNSQGVEALQESTLLSGEFNLLAKGPERESEVFKAFKRRRVQDLDLSRLAREAASQGLLRGEAKLPATGSFDVVFSGEALDHLFSWFCTQASAAAKYNRISRFEPGMMLCQAEPGCSPVTLWHSALIPYAVGSYRVDASGSPGCRRLLVEGGKLKARWSQARYAQYLRQEASGELANIEVEPGKYSEADLLKPEGGRPLYHLFDFSYFEPSPVTGEFAAEIRLGEEITDSGRRPVRGGSVSGSSQAAFARALFSLEREQRERYLGPKWIRCQNLTLAGA